MAISCHKSTKTNLYFIKWCAYLWLAVKPELTNAESISLTLRMPEISRFYGIIIRMFFNDHLPPHFHAAYSEYNAQINITTGEIVNGELPTSG
jgi:hypothetical protein